MSSGAGRQDRKLRAAFAERKIAAAANMAGPRRAGRRPELIDSACRSVPVFAMSNAVVRVRRCRQQADEQSGEQAEQRFHASILAGKGTELHAAIGHAPRAAFFQLLGTTG